MSESQRYTVTDNNDAEEGLSFEEAVGVIADWWEKAADMNEVDVSLRGEVVKTIRRASAGVSTPEMGSRDDLGQLQWYAHLVCHAVAVATGLRAGETGLLLVVTLD